MYHFFYFLFVELCCHWMWDHQPAPYPTDSGLRRQAACSTTVREWLLEGPPPRAKESLQFACDSYLALHLISLKHQVSLSHFIYCATVLLRQEQNKLAKRVISSWANLMEGTHPYLLALRTRTSVSSGERLRWWRRTPAFCLQIIRAPRVQRF